MQSKESRKEGKGNKRKGKGGKEREEERKDGGVWNGKKSKGTKVRKDGGIKKWTNERMKKNKAGRKEGKCQNSYIYYDSLVLTFNLFALSHADMATATRFSSCFISNLCTTSLFKKTGQRKTQVILVMMHKKHT